MNSLMKLALQCYLYRDRIAFTVGAVEALIGALGMYLAYPALDGNATLLTWWAFLVGAWLVVTGGLSVAKGPTDPKAAKERQLYAEKMAQAGS